MQDARIVTDLNAVPWVSMDELFAKRGGRGRCEMKSVVAPSGKRVGLIHADGEGMPHFHTKASSFFILKGTMELRDRIVGPGTWGIEPYGAIHPNTKFHDVTYGLGMADGDFGVGNVILDSVDAIPEWMAQAGFKLDDYATLVDTQEIGWLPFGDGLSIKVLYVFEGRGAFAAIVRAAAGAKLPPRRYVGPADLYVISGRAVFGNTVAGEGMVVHEPAGADEAAVHFPVATEFLANSYGTILEFDEKGSVARVIDGFALRDLAHVRTDGGATVGARSAAEIEGALQHFAAASKLRPAL